MKKNELKLGQVVEVTNGTRYLVTSINNSTYLINESGFMDLSKYEEDLTKRISDDYSIVKVFNIKPGVYGFGFKTISDDSCLELVWERPQKMTRQEANREILKLLSEIVEKEPDLRFHQILLNFNVEDPHSDLFYEESEDTLNELKYELGNQ